MWNMKDAKVVVIGAGLGGLSAAAYLSKKGLDVQVFERNAYPGGYACSFVRGDYEFEAALHALSGIGPEDNRGSCYRLLEGCDVAGRLEFIPIPDFYSSAFPDFTVTIPFGWDAAEEAYAENFPSERKGINRLLTFMRQISQELQVMSAGPGAIDMLTFPVKGSHLIRSVGLTTAQALDREISDPKLKALFCDLWGYYGLPPSRLSFTLFAIANASYIEYGPYHIKGTSQALSDAFVDVIEENGGRVHLRNGVTKIDVDGAKVTGVVTESGDEVSCDYIVSNANPIQACYGLIGAEHVPGSYLKALAEGHIAVSTYNVYMGLDCTAGDLGVPLHHELFVNDGYDQDEHYRSMYNIEKQKYYVITNYNASDPEFSPPGTSVVVLTGLMDYGAWVSVPPDDYVDVKNRLAAEMIEDAEKYMPGLSDHLEVVEVSTPITNMRYSANPGGSILGFDYDLTGNSLFRLPNRGPLEGLSFANAWVRTGGGFESCIASGYFAYGEVMKDLKGVSGLKRLIPGF
jgi:phytoene dehydrogenase-like protein